MKRYLFVLVVAVVLGAVGLVLGPRLRVSGAPSEEPEAPAVVTLDLVITGDEHLTPSIASVPKDHVVKLSVTNHHRRRVTLTLRGYQDRFGIADVAPDSVWHGEFLADRPGEGFAWMLEGAPVGRLEVTGSHLVEGHR